MAREATMDIDLVEVMTELARKRPVFHLECDFQVALASQLRRAAPVSQVSLEYKPFGREPRAVDIWVESGPDGPPIAIELKYRTVKLDFEVGGERYRLRKRIRRL